MATQKAASSWADREGPPQTFGNLLQLSSPLAAAIGARSIRVLEIASSRSLNDIDDDEMAVSMKQSA